MSIDYAKIIEANAIGVGYGTTVTKEYLNFAHKNGMEVWKWTVNKEAEMQELIDLGLDGLITDFPDKALKKLNTIQNKEKKAIIETLNNETKAAFQRDYESWTKKWVHSPTITKTYINFAENSFSESVGWEEISSFVKTYIEEHPTPEPLPKLLDKVAVRLYGTGAWVSYEQQDSIRGLKRETRLMEKINGQWKIAGMQTTIYGFKTKD